MPQHGGDGGAIAVDTEGNVSLVLNTRGMYRGWVCPDGARGNAIYQDAWSAWCRRKRTPLH